MRGFRGPAAMKASHLCKARGGCALLSCGRTGSGLGLRRELDTFSTATTLATAPSQSVRQLTTEERPQWPTPAKTLTTGDGTDGSISGDAGDLISIRLSQLPSCVIRPPEEYSRLIYDVPKVEVVVVPKVLSERERLLQRLAERRREMQQLVDKRSQVMAVLYSDRVMSDQTLEECRRELKTSDPVNEATLVEVLEMVKGVEKGMRSVHLPHVIRMVRF